LADFSKKIKEISPFFGVSEVTDEISNAKTMGRDVGDLTHEAKTYD